MTGLPPTGLDADPLIGAEVAQYRIDERIARGGMGVVYRAEHVRLGRTVALKVIAPELSQDQAYRRRFELEARAAVSIDNPHAVGIYDYGEQDGRLYIVMRYVDGPDLSTLIEQEGSLGAERAADVIAQAAQALDAAHAIDLVHRDVKPANLLIDRARGHDHVFVTDFGLIRAASASRSGITRTGGVVGTLDFVAPEQIGDDPVSPRTDVYALGCVLYYALAGEVPFPAGSEAAKLNAHLSAPPPVLSDAGLHAKFGPVLERAMAKLPDDRYQSAGELGEAALAAAATRGRRFAPMPKPEPETAPPREPAPEAASEPPKAAPEPPPAEQPVTPPRRTAASGRTLARVAAVLALAGVAAAAVSMVLHLEYRSIVEIQRTSLDLVSFGLLALVAVLALALWIKGRALGPGVTLAVMAGVAGFHACQTANFVDGTPLAFVLATAGELCILSSGLVAFAAWTGTLKGDLPPRRLASLLVLGGGLVAAGGLFVDWTPPIPYSWWEMSLRFRLPLIALVGTLLVLAVLSLAKPKLAGGVLRTAAAALALGYAAWVSSELALVEHAPAGVGMIGVPAALLVAVVASVVAGRPSARVT